MINHLRSHGTTVNSNEENKKRKYNHFLYDADESEYEPEKADKDSNDLDKKQKSIQDAILNFIVGTYHHLSIIDIQTLKR